MGLGAFLIWRVPKIRLGGNSPGPACGPPGPPPWPSGAGPPSGGTGRSCSGRGVCLRLRRLPSAPGSGADAAAGASGLGGRVRRVCLGAGRVEGHSGQAIDLGHGSRSACRSTAGSGRCAAAGAWPSVGPAAGLSSTAPVTCQPPRHRPAPPPAQGGRTSLKMGSLWT